MNRKIRILFFILLIISFIIVLFFGIFGNSLSFYSSKEIKQNRELKKDLISNLKINNGDTVYDKNNNIYYYMVSENYENQIYVLKLEMEDEFKYKIVGETLNVIKVDYSKPIKIIIYNDKYYYETKIQLTNLPLVNIETDYEITTNDTESIFNYININNIEKTVSNNSIIYIRGDTSQRFGKKSYKLKFVNKKYDSDKNINVSNFYYGDALILDAIYRDPSKIRNVLATELWNDISNNFTNIDIYSEFVEIFINGEYKGIYVLTEPINRRKLNLNKSNLVDTSIIIKTTGWLTVNNTIKFNDIDTSTFLEYELKYPNDEELYSASWDKILNKLSVYYSNSGSYDAINTTWNMENYIDLIIFNAFTNNQDNQLLKNNYFYMKSLEDSEVFIQPWDMEYTFGLSYSSSDEKLVTKKQEDYAEVYTGFEHKSKRINKLLIERYWKLRKNILTKEYFDNLLNEYKNKLSKGATERDSKIWYEYDVEKEIEEIRSWIYNRLEFFDGYIASLENE